MTSTLTNDEITDLDNKIQSLYESTTSPNEGSDDHSTTK